MSKSHQNVHDLEHSSIKKLLWKYFLPAFAGVIINSLYNIVDRIFIGQGVDEFALAGLGSVFPVMLIIMAFGMLVGIGAGVRVSINLGKKDFDRAEKVLGTAFVLIIILSLFVTVLGFVIKEPMLRLFGAGDATAKYANEYLNIILLGTLFGTMGFSFNNIIRSEGNAKIAMYSMLLSAGTNILLDPLFIFVFNMGVKGAALATLISQFVLMIWVLKHFRGRFAVVKLKLKNIKLNAEIAWYIFAIGFAPFSMQLASSAVMGTYNTQLFKYGKDMAVGAMSVILSITMLIFMTIIAINMASQPIISFNHGAKNYKRVKETFITCLRAASYVALAGTILVQVFPVQIIKIFNRESTELLEVGVRGLRLFLMAWPIVGFQIVVSNYYQSTGKAGIATILSLQRQVIFLIPILLWLPSVLGLTGVWISGPISDTLSGIVVAFFLFTELKRINKNIALQAN
jgi:putative MATE family efflux protein